MGTFYRTPHTTTTKTHGIAFLKMCATSPPLLTMTLTIILHCRCETCRGLRAFPRGVGIHHVLDDRFLSVFLFLTMGGREWPSPLSFCLGPLFFPLRGGFSSVVQGRCALFFDSLPCYAWESCVKRSFQPKHIRMNVGVSRQVGGCRT